MLRTTFFLGACLLAIATFSSDSKAADSYSLDGLGIMNVNGETVGFYFPDAWIIRPFQASAMLPGSGTKLMRERGTMFEPDWVQGEAISNPRLRIGPQQHIPSRGVSQSKVNCRSMYGWHTTGLPSFSHARADSDIELETDFHGASVGALTVAWGTPKTVNVSNAFALIKVKGRTPVKLSVVALIHGGTTRGYTVSVIMDGEVVEEEEVLELSGSRRAPLVRFNHPINKGIFLDTETSLSNVDGPNGFIRATSEVAP